MGDGLNHDAGSKESTQFDRYVRTFRDLVYEDMMDQAINNDINQQQERFLQSLANILHNDNGSFNNSLKKMLHLSNQVEVLFVSVSI